ncbi:unnamed protein product, partial [Mesorhabditis belari]|uniref:RRM domain-containing protein n=1 Tax=Mesorhabditis belari TaxID=2138241 RepID=A0AAF3J7Q1_9BILA
MDKWSSKLNSATENEEKSNKLEQTPVTIAIDDDASSPEDTSSCRIFISNIPFSWTEKELREFLKDYEPVEEVEIVYNERGSKGFGFATINDQARCFQARVNLNHKVIDGRRVEVRRAHKIKKARNVPSPSSLIQMPDTSSPPIQELNLPSFTAQWQQAMYFQSLMSPGGLNLLNNPFLAMNLIQASLQNAVMTSRQNSLEPFKWPFLPPAIPPMFGLNQGIAPNIGLNSFPMMNGAIIGSDHGMLPKPLGLVGPGFSFGLSDVLPHSNDLLLSGQSVSTSHFASSMNRRNSEQEIALGSEAIGPIHSKRERTPRDSQNYWTTDRQKRRSGSYSSPSRNTRRSSRWDRP